VDWKGLACPYECFVHLKCGIYEMATISVLIFNIPVDPYGKYLKLSLDVQNKSGPLVPLYNQNNMIEMWADNRQQRWKRKETEK
jgi:hypothetical protein